MASAGTLKSCAFLATIAVVLCDTPALSSPQSGAAPSPPATQVVRRAAPISADEVTLRHKIGGDARVTIFLLDIPPGEATALHRHDRDLLTVFVNGGRTRAAFNGAAPVEDTFTPGDVRFRSAGFTHYTENIGVADFRAVIFEFAESQGVRVPAARPPTHACEARTGTACVDVKPLFCTDRFCVDDVIVAPGASLGQEGERILVTVSDGKVTEADGPASTAETRRSGDVRQLAAGGSSRLTNVGSSPFNYVMVTFR